MGYAPAIWQVLCLIAILIISFAIIKYVFSSNKKTED